jgi:hypothetical protein
VPNLETAVRELRLLVTERALATDDPWVLMHAVLALGADAKHGKGTALDAVVHEWTQREQRGSGSWPMFPLSVEAHPNHFVEIMVSVGVPGVHRFATAHAGTVTLDEFVAGAKALFTPAIAGPELAWTVSVLTNTMPPTADAFTNAEGREFTVAAIVEANAQAAEAGYRDTIAAMRGTRPYGRSALQGLACNGTHVLYGLLDALRNGYEGQNLRARVRTLVQASIYRLDPEVALIDEKIGGSTAPLARLNADAAKLQFLGHSLENIGFAHREKIYEPTAAERTAIKTAEGRLAGVVHRITSEPDQLEGLKLNVPRAYSLILGDACHALHGLEAG